MEKSEKIKRKEKKKEKKKKKKRQRERGKRKKKQIEEKEGLTKIQAGFMIQGFYEDNICVELHQFEDVK